MHIDTQLRCSQHSITRTRQSNEISAPLKLVIDTLLLGFPVRVTDLDKPGVSFERIALFLTVTFE